jgi:hypothetical protein
MLTVLPFVVDCLDLRSCHTYETETGLNTHRLGGPIWCQTPVTPDGRRPDPIKGFQRVTEERARIYLV